jgi:hypothetical protein
MACVYLEHVVPTAHDGNAQYCADDLDPRILVLVMLSGRARLPHRLNLFAATYLRALLPSRLRQNMFLGLYSNL